MRLWHVDLIPKLSKQRLLGQHRECCALRGKGWGKKHSTVDYVFNHPIGCLYDYHLDVMNCLSDLGIKISESWWNIEYRGKNMRAAAFGPKQKQYYQYPEHDEKYLAECLGILESRGERINI